MIPLKTNQENSLKKELISAFEKKGFSEVTYSISTEDTELQKSEKNIPELLTSLNIHDQQTGKKALLKLLMSELPWTQTDGKRQFLGKKIEEFGLQVQGISEEEFFISYPQFLSKIKRNKRFFGQGGPRLRQKDRPWRNGLSLKEAYVVSLSEEDNFDTGVETQVAQENLKQASMNPFYGLRQKQTPALSVEEDFMDSFNSSDSESEEPLSSNSSDVSDLAYLSDIESETPQLNEVYDTDEAYNSEDEETRALLRKERLSQRMKQAQATTLEKWESQVHQQIDIPSIKKNLEKRDLTKLSQATI